MTPEQLWHEVCQLARAYTAMRNGMQAGTVAINANMLETALVEADKVIAGIAKLQTMQAVTFVMHIAGSTSHDVQPDAVVTSPQPAPLPLPPQPQPTVVVQKTSYHMQCFSCRRVYDVELAPGEDQWACPHCNTAQQFPQSHSWQCGGCGGKYKWGPVMPKTCPLCQVEQY